MESKFYPKLTNTEAAGVLKECDRKQVLVIVLFIIGHTRNRAQGTPRRKPISGFRADTTAILRRKSNRDSMFIC